jgi:hypothetical protein
MLQTSLGKVVLDQFTRYLTIFFLFEIISFIIFAFYSPIDPLTLWRHSRRNAYLKMYIFLFPMQGILLDGTIIAVKQLSSKSKQGSREFVNEIGMISGLQHPNLVRLYGCCIEAKQLLLVYEYMENNSLANALFGKLMFYTLPCILC